MHVCRCADMYVGAMSLDCAPFMIVFVKGLYPPTSCTISLLVSVYWSCFCQIISKEQEYTHKNTLLIDQHRRLWVLSSTSLHPVHTDSLQTRSSTYFGNIFVLVFACWTCSAWATPRLDQLEGVAMATCLPVEGRSWGRHTFTARCGRSHSVSAYTLN